MKYIKKILFMIILTFICLLRVEAASGSIKASTSAKSAVVGSVFTVTVKVTCSEAIGSWQFGITYDSAYISLVSGDTSVASFGDGTIKSKTYTYKFKAIKAGTASIKISSPSMVPWNDENDLFTPTTSNASITIKTQAEIEASYSKDNTLKSLSVEGYELTPAFDKDTLEYSVSVPDSITEIKVTATKNDSSASVSGVGNIDISEGVNKVEVVVTAENGSIKTYTIMVNVSDLSPIEVTIDGDVYTVVKKRELLTAPTGFSDTSITIDGIEVPAFTSSLVNLTVLGLKDESGNIAMYVYDVDANTYEKYYDIKNNSFTLYPMKITSVLDGFTKVSIEIDGIEVDALKSNTLEDLYVIYATNLESGEESYYIYDQESKSFIYYDNESFSHLILSITEYKIFFIASLVVAIILLLITIIESSRNRKLKRFIKSLQEKEEPIETAD